MGSAKAVMDVAIASITTALIPKADAFAHVIDAFACIIPSLATTFRAIAPGTNAFVHGRCAIAAGSFANAPGDDAITRATTAFADDGNAIAPAAKALPTCGPPMPLTMKTVKAGLRGLSPLDLMAKALHVEQMMNGNPAFPFPNPTMAELQTAREALRAAIAAALDGGRTAHFNLRTATRHMQELLTKLAGYVNSVAGGDAEKLQSSGLELRNFPQPTGFPDMPQRLVARFTDHHGQIKLRWSPVKGAYLYEVFIHEGEEMDEAGWRALGTVTHASHVVNGLITGRFYWFRVRAIGVSGQSPFSDPAQSLAI